MFKIGEVVELKSGGPDMTVDMLLDSGRVRCAWFDASMNQQFGAFDPATLKAATSSVNLD